MRRSLLSIGLMAVTAMSAVAADRIHAWEDALPLGNGQAGALVWGGGDTLRLTLDRADYWHLSTNTMFRNPEFTWKNLIAYATRPLEDRKRVFEGRVGDSTKLPGVRLELRFANAEIVGLRLDLAKAEAVVALRGSDKVRELRAWFVDDDPLLHVALPADVRIKSAEFVKNPAIDRLGGYPDPVVTRTSGKIVYRRGNRAEGEWAKEFVAGVRLVPADAPSDVAWWNRFYAESSVSIPDAGLQRLYDLAMYLYGSGSRDGFAPIALQGVWTADNGDLPPWHGDYHHDLNSQMTYWASPIAGHFNAHDAFTSHMLRLRPAFRAYARRFFGIDRGMVIPGAMGYDGSWIAGWSQYAIPPSSGLWAFSILFDGWRYNPTRERLEAIYPFGEELAEAADLLLLPPDANDVRRWPLSTSPEVGDNGNSAWFRPNSNYDRSILSGFFGQMALLAAAKGDASAETRYRGLAKSAGPASLSGDGRYLLSADRDLTESHRHISHLLDIFPYCDLAPGADARRSLDHFERLGTKEWIGFSFAWTAAMEARIGDGSRAADYLSVFARAFVSKSGLHLNGDQTKSGYSNFVYKPFTLEANFAFARAIQEMLIGDYPDGVHIFPALPRNWKGRPVSFRGLRVAGGHRVSAELHEDGTISGSVTGFSSGRVVLMLPGGACRRIDLVKDVPVPFGETQVVDVVERDGENALDVILRIRNEISRHCKTSPEGQLVWHPMRTGNGGVGDPTRILHALVNIGVNSYIWGKKDPRISIGPSRGPFADKAVLENLPFASLKPAISRHWLLNPTENRLEEKRNLVRTGAGTCYDVVMIGDSITHLFETTSGSYDESKCGIREWEALSVKFRMLNLGFGGDHFENVLWNVLHGGMLDGISARIVTLMIGTNNRDDGAERVAEGIGACISAIRMKQPGAVVFLHPIIPRIDPALKALRVKNERVNSLIRPLADGKRIVWVDLREVFDGKGLTAAEQAELFTDGTHPSAKGYRKWREMIEPLVSDALMRFSERRDSKFGGD